MPSNGQNSPAIDSASTLRGVVGDDSTAEFENDPAFVDSNPTGNASSENLGAAEDLDDEEDDETEEDDLDDSDEELEDDELEDEDDELEDEDDDLDDEDDAEELVAGPAIDPKQKRPSGTVPFRPLEQRRSQGSRYVMSTVRA